jgi:hypothetical protein
LVMAVQSEIPLIQSSIAPTYLVDLARRCLLKNPRLRTRFIEWRDFGAPGTSPPTSPKDEVIKRIAISRAAEDSAKPHRSDTVDPTELKLTILQYLKVAARSIRSDELLPPVKTTLHPPGGSGLRFVFAASGSHQLPHGLSLFVEVDILDPSAQAVAIRGCACASDIVQNSISMNHSIFEGIYEGSTVYQHFEDFLYEALLWAQGETPEMRLKEQLWKPPER